MCVYTLVQRSWAALSSAKSPDFVALKARLLPCISKRNMESKSFPSNFDIAGRYAKHRKLHYLRFSEQGLVANDTKKI